MLKLTATIIAAGIAAAGLSSAALAQSTGADASAGITASPSASSADSAPTGGNVINAAPANVNDGAALGSHVGAANPSPNSANDNAPSGGNVTLATPSIPEGAELGRRIIADPSGGDVNAPASGNGAQMDAQALPQYGQ